MKTFLFMIFQIYFLSFYVYINKIKSETKQEEENCIAAAVVTVCGVYEQKKDSNNKSAVSYLIENS